MRQLQAQNAVKLEPPSLSGGDLNKKDVEVYGSISCNTIKADTIIIIKGGIKANSIKANNIIQMPFIADKETVRTLMENY